MRARTQLATSAATSSGATRIGMLATRATASAAPSADRAAEPVQPVEVGGAVEAGGDVERDPVGERQAGGAAPEQRRRAQGAGHLVARDRDQRRQQRQGDVEGHRDGLARELAAHEPVDRILGVEVGRGHRRKLPGRSVDDVRGGCSTPGSRRSRQEPATSGVRPRPPPRARPGHGSAAVTVTA